MTASALCGQVEMAGPPNQNSSRLEQQLRADRGTSKAGRNAWRLHPRNPREAAMCRRLLQTLIIETYDNALRFLNSYDAR